MNPKQPALLGELVDASAHRHPKASGQATSQSPSPVWPDLPIGGLVPFSTTDWPGHIAITVFLRGCPWRCFYCHNPQLQVFRGPVVPTRDCIDLLEQRRGLIDAVVLSGGEPMLHRRLGQAINYLHTIGYQVGLHTNGMYPTRLDQLLNTHPPDWVGLDIKTVAHCYGNVVKPENPTGPIARRAADAVIASLEILQHATVPFEVRTTVPHSSLIAAHLDELATYLGKTHISTWAIQKAQGDDDPGAIFEHWAANAQSIATINGVNQVVIRN